MAEKQEEQNLKLQKYMNRIEAAEKFRQGYEELWKRCYKRWRNHVDKIYDAQGKEVKDRSNISIPYTFVQVETILPRLVESLFAARPYVSVKGREPSDEDNAKNMEVLLDWQTSERMDLKDIFASGLKGLCIYGTGVAYEGWKYEEREVIRKQPVEILEVDEEDNPIIGPDGSVQPLLDEMGEPITELQPVKINMVEHDDPEVKFLDLFLFYVDPNAADVEDARYCGHVEYMTKEELTEREALGYKLDWEQINNEDKQNEARNQRMNSVGLPSANNNTNNEDNLYEVHHYWEDDKHVVIINRTYIALERDNPFWHMKKPYVKDVYTEVPGEFYGMGIVETVESLQDELNTERNMRIDYRSFALRRMFKVRRGAQINKNQLKWRQGGIVEVDNMDDIEDFKIDTSVGATFNQEETIKMDFKDATGAHDVLMGTANSSETATSTMTKDNNASIRFKHIISSIEKRLLASVIKFMIQLNQQFIDSEKILRVTGEGGDEWKNISPEEIQGEFDLIPMGTSVEPQANKEAFKQRMVELYTILSKDPMVSSNPMKQRNLLKKVLDAFDIKDTDSLLPTDEELMAMLQPPIPPEDELSIGGGANTALMQEQGLPMGGGPFG
jgi:hypothetical protein